MLFLPYGKIFNGIKMNPSNDEDSPYGRIRTASELGEVIRSHRKQQHLTLEKVSSVTHLGMRFLSEIERGKETAELGKVLEALNKMGLEIIIVPRGYQHND
jgi:HTH-type transcriptional regulator/antitoxin HipB